MTRTLFAVAWRNLTGHLGRTLLTVATIAIGLAAMIFLWGFSGGLQQNMLDNFQDTIVGSVQVHRRGFFKQPALIRHITVPREVTTVLETAGVDRWTLRLEAFALAAGPESSGGLLLIGMDPVRERLVTRLADKVTEGRFLEQGDRYVCVLGATTARNLGVSLGDEVVLISYDRFGVLSAEQFVLVGIITSGEVGIDKGLAVVPLISVQEMLEMRELVTSIPIRVESRRLERLVRHLQASLNVEHYDILRWHDMFPVLREWMTLSDGFHYVFLGIVLFIVLAGVVNTVLLSMLERTRELGVLMALGMRAQQIGALLSLEAVLIGVMGTVLGTVLGLGLVSFTAQTGIDLSVLLGPTERFYVDPVIRPGLQIEHLAFSTSTVFLTSLLAGFYPALRAARLEPAEAVRHV